MLTGLFVLSLSLFLSLSLSLLLVVLVFYSLLFYLLMHVQRKHFLFYSSFSLQNVSMVDEASYSESIRKTVCVFF